jgi:putative transposase
MTARLNNQPGFQVNHKRVTRLMGTMGLQAAYPRPCTSIPNKAHKTYPYLLRGPAITQPNQVWCADNTYVPLSNGFTYLVAIMDWYSRYVLAWQLFNTGMFLGYQPRW